MIRGLNTSSAHALLDRIGDESTFFSLPEAELKCLARLRKDDFTSDTTRKSIIENADREDTFVYANGIRLRYFRDNDYPQRLIDPPDSPVMLYQLGDTNLDAKYSVAIVGTRHATPLGVKITRTIVQDLANALGDVMIVSGLAYGIDVAAHRAALDAGLPTVGVMAHPLNSIYPPAHRNIAAEMIRKGGSLVSEYPTSAKIHPVNFLARNRIIAALSDVVIVVESDIKGGAMTTAQLGWDYNREVMAVPGRIVDQYSNGTNRLIATQRASMYTGIESLLSLMGWTAKTKPAVERPLLLNLTDDQKKVFDFIIANPDLTLNDIIRSTGIPMSKLSDILFQLEVNDYIIALPGGRYTPVST